MIYNDGLWKIYLLDERVVNRMYICVVFLFLRDVQRSYSKTVAVLRRGLEDDGNMSAEQLSIHRTHALPLYSLWNVQ